MVSSTVTLPAVAWFIFGILYDLFAHNSNIVVMLLSFVMAVLLVCTAVILEAIKGNK